ncbi:MAG: DUF559 domain-containing protein [Treponema sp.]|nr:DUF559 domain-containing protein [Treponema sp.]MBQ2354401.1 DUF559 domain-containing protein [Treponema sp.]MBR4247456.1 DUF559 domain-containing protein [Treponema sp.]
MKLKVEPGDFDPFSDSYDYKISIPISGDLTIDKKMTENELKNFLEEIVEVLGYKEIVETFKCTVKDAREISEKLKRNSECRECDLKMKECFRCCKVCQSPLEQKLLKALVRTGIKAEMQLRINKDNTLSHFPEPVNPEKILTIPDFYVETENKKICIYTDGHTYHERTEYQAVRDRSIDRELQNLGYIVLRYTTSEINQKLQESVDSIKKTMGI